MQERMVRDLTFPVRVTEFSWVKWGVDEKRKEEPVELLFLFLQIKTHS